jgi:mono/diheme cytochrome c family protein
MRDARLRYAAVALVGSIAALCTLARAQSGANAQDFALLERGRYLTVAADCAACHDDPDQDRPFAGGRPIETPFGHVVATNITPDRETGIGAWSDAQFEAVLRHGKLPNGRDVYPAMPFPYYTKMSAADVHAIRAYLNTVPPAHHVVVADQLPFPFRIRALLVVWDALYFMDQRFKEIPGRSSAWNRGAYLVEGPGHCAACHTPKTLLGGDKSDQPLRGYSLQGWFAPNLTDDPQRGLAAWTVPDIVEYLQRGHNRFAAASGPMAEEVTNSSSKMTKTDLEAIALYLKDQGGQQERAAALSSSDPDMIAGAAIYADLCSACHRPDGTGVPYLIPNLAASASVASKQPTSIIRVVLEGAQSAATDQEPTGPAMPAYGWQLNDAQVAAVSTFIRNSWSHAASAVTPGEVQKARRSLDAARQ